MSGIWNAIAALGAYFVLVLLVYPALKGIFLWGFNLGTWVLLLSCPVFLWQSLRFINKEEQQETDK